MVESLAREQTPGVCVPCLAAASAPQLVAQVSDSREAEKQGGAAAWLGSANALCMSVCYLPFPFQNTRLD